MNLKEQMFAIASLQLHCYANDELLKIIRNGWQDIILKIAAIDKLSERGFSLWKFGIKKTTIDKYENIKKLPEECFILYRENKQTKNFKITHLEELTRLSHYNNEQIIVNVAKEIMENFIDRVETNEWINWILKHNDENYLLKHLTCPGSFNKFFNIKTITAEKTALWNRACYLNKRLGTIEEWFYSKLNFKQQKLLIEMTLYNFIPDELLKFQNQGLYKIYEAYCEHETFLYNGLTIIENKMGNLGLSSQQANPNIDCMTNSLPLFIKKVFSSDSCSKFAKEFMEKVLKESETQFNNKVALSNNGNSNTVKNGKDIRAPKLKISKLTIKKQLVTKLKNKKKRRQTSKKNNVNKPRFLPLQNDMNEIQKKVNKSEPNLSLEIEEKNVCYQKAPLVSTIITAATKTVLPTKEPPTNTEMNWALFDATANIPSTITTSTNLIFAEIKLGEKSLPSHNKKVSVPPVNIKTVNALVEPEQKLVAQTDIQTYYGL